MTDAPERVWSCCGCGSPAPFNCDCATEVCSSPGLGTRWKNDVCPERASAEWKKDPEVMKLVAEAEARVLRIAAGLFPGGYDSNLARIAAAIRAAKGEPE